MSDVFSKDKRSEIMSKVRSSGNRSTELQLIAFFKENHITGWQRHYNVIGHPDFVFKERRIALFVDGCFWHGHDCRNTRPIENAEYWQKKREHNIQHDIKIMQHFEERGWRVIRVWECELKKKNKPILIEKLSDLSISL